MPLIKSKSQKSFGKNVEAEMDAGKPQPQALAIAYSVKRKSKGKKMAYGGMAENTNEPSVPGRKADDERPSKEDYMGGDFTTGPDPKRKPDDERLPKEKYMSGQEGFSGEGSEEPEMMAYGGEAEATQEPGIPKKKPDDRRLAKEDYMGDDWAGGPDPERKPDDSRPPEGDYMADHWAYGGEQGNPKLAQSHMEPHDASVADAIMNKKKKMKMYADGGMVDLETNSEEGVNEYYHQNQEAGLKEQYDDEQFKPAPLDSGEHGDDGLDKDEHDMINVIRRKLKAKGKL